MNLTNKKITIIGCKRSGMALAKLAVRLEARVRISEYGSEDSVTPEDRKWFEQNHISVEFDGHTQEFIEESDFVIVSPGVPFDAQPVQWARAKGIPVLGEVEFAFQFCSKPVIAVTGSCGKTTVVTLISDVLQAAGHKVSLCGNIGMPFSEQVLATADKDYVVLEVSSFQLETLLSSEDCQKYDVKGFQPQISVLLNLSPNHLDRHKDFEEYKAAKTSIFLNQTSTNFAVVNQNDALTKDLVEQVKAKVCSFNNSDENPNYAAVREVAKILDVDSDICDQTFQAFKGIEHRLEWVRNINGIDFINDSKATTTQSTIWAFNRVQQPILMLCGGKDKNLDFTPLTKMVTDKVKRMFVFGEAIDKIQNTFENYVDIETCASMKEAVVRAQATAIEGDCVLLSPMCASFDMFKNYEERGKVFKEIVNNLK